LFQGIEMPLQVTRNHSLIVNKTSLPDMLEITAWSTDIRGEFDEIMALQHKTLPIMSVQFHPESVLTMQGEALLNNFLTLCK
jgi:anthranilate/para-aminobenzoate synthase component II